MDYQKAYDQAVSELETLKAEKSVVDSRIKDFAESLGLDTTQPLQPQIEKKSKELKEQIEKKENSLKFLLDELESMELSHESESRK